MKTLIFFIIIFFLILGCALPQAQKELSLKMPCLPQHWPDSNQTRAYLISFLNHDQLKQEIIHEFNKQDCILSLPDNSVIPILARPLYQSHQINIKPAGVLVFPGQEQAELSWQQGPAAWIIMELAKKKIDYGALNHSKLLDSLSQKNTSGWDIDQQRLIKDLKKGEVNSFSFKQKKERQINLPAAEGIWYSSDPLKPEYYSRNGFTVDVHLGISQFFCPERKEVWEIFFAEQGMPQIEVFHY